MSEKPGEAQSAGSLAIRDFYVNGAPVTDAIYINGKPSILGTPFVSLSNYSVDGAVTIANATNAFIEGVRGLTWTIGLTFGGNAVGMTTSANVGSYVRNGNRVTVSGLLQLTNKGSSTGNALITGLPFTVRNNSDSYSVASMYFGSVTYTGSLQGIVTPNTTSILPAYVNEAGGYVQLTDANFGNSSFVAISATYTVS